MNLIVRADDVGYTNLNNIGVFEAIDQGIVTSADVMLDTPGTIDALTRLKEYPWISIGWHAHFWGKPVLPPEEIPSMVNEEGKFKFRKKKELKATCNYEEVLQESRAQMELCLRVLGRVPDTAGIIMDGSEFEAARLQVCKEYGIVYNYYSKPDAMGVIQSAREQYRSLQIYMPNQPATVYKTCYADSYQQRLTYDPVRYYTEDQGNILDKEIALTAWHPGYLDPYIMGESSLHEARLIDIKALCSLELKQWIIDHQIKLINQRDAIYGTNEYQNHLRNIHSPLYIGK